MCIGKNFVLPGTPVRVYIATQLVNYSITVMHALTVIASIRRD